MGEFGLNESELSILRRVERLPFGRFHWRLLWMGGLGYTFDAMDGAMIAFILPAVRAQWALTTEPTRVEIADHRRAAQYAGLLTRDRPLSPYRRKDEGDHCPIHRIEGVTQPAHPEQAPMEPAERQALHAPENAQLGFV